MPRSRANLKVIRPAPRSTPPARTRAAQAASSEGDGGSAHGGSTQRIVESITSAIV